MSEFIEFVKACGTVILPLAAIILSIASLSMSLVSMSLVLKYEIKQMRNERYMVE